MSVFLKPGPNRTAEHRAFAEAETADIRRSIDVSIHTMMRLKADRDHFLRWAWIFGALLTAHLLIDGLFLLARLF